MTVLAWISGYLVGWLLHHHCVPGCKRRPWQLFDHTSQQGADE